VYNKILKYGITNTQITKCTRYYTIYTDLKSKRFVKHMNRHKGKECVYHKKGQPEFHRMLFAT